MRTTTVILIIGLIAILTSSLIAQEAAITDGVNWLVANQDASGLWGTDEKTPFRDATTFNLANESRAGGEYTDDFNFTTMPLKTFVRIRIRWGSGAQLCEKTQDLPVPFQNLGIYRHSQYNTPSEGDATCQGFA